MISKQTIMDAYVFLRKNNNSIPDATLDFMKDASLSAYEAITSIVQPSHQTSASNSGEENKPKAVATQPAVQFDLLERLNQEVLQHFNSEVTILKNVKDEISAEEYKYRMNELRRQRFYMRLLILKLRKSPEDTANIDATAKTKCITKM